MLGGWLRRYLLNRLAKPWGVPAPHRVLAAQASREVLDQALMQLGHETGVIFGCPVIQASHREAARGLGFPRRSGQVLFVYLETLFGVTLAEAAFWLPEEAFDVRLTKVLHQVFRFYLDHAEAPEAFTQPLSWRLEHDPTLLKLLRRLERYWIQRLSVRHSFFFQHPSLQNLFGFIDLYYLVHWNFYFWKIKPPHPELCLAELLQAQLQLKEQLILTMAALVWADRVLVDVEKVVLRRYIKQAHFPKAMAQHIRERLRQEVKLGELPVKLESVVLKEYLIETLILISLIDNQQAPQEQALIQEVAQHLGLSEDQTQALYLAVGNFFQQHGHRFNFLKGNPAVTQIQNYAEERVMVAVKKNTERMMQEVRETQELYTLLVKSASQPLTSEEKQKVKEQLLDIAKTIPALAIFCLPAGAVLLAVLIKVLPFNLLPSAFQEEET